MHLMERTEYRRIRCRLKKYGCYVIGALLAVFYMLTLYQALHPQITPEYKNYYVDQTAKKWGGNHSYNYVLGTPIRMISENNELHTRMGPGWSFAEKEFCWSLGTYSEMYFKNLPQQEMMLCLDIETFIDAQGILTISVNGEKIGELAFYDLKDGYDCELKISPELLEEGYAAVRFDYSSPRYVDGDSRWLGVCFCEVMIK